MGIYYLTIHWTATRNVNFNACKIHVIFNEELIMTLTPNTYSIIKNTLKLNVTTKTAIKKLKLCATD